MYDLYKRLFVSAVIITHMPFALALNQLSERPVSLDCPEEQEVPAGQKCIEIKTKVQAYKSLGVDFYHSMEEMEKAEENRNGEIKKADSYQGHITLIDKPTASTTSEVNRPRTSVVTKGNMPDSSYYEYEFYRPKTTGLKHSKKLKEALDDEDYKLHLIYFKDEQSEKLPPAFDLVNYLENRTLKESLKMKLRDLDGQLVAITLLPMTTYPVDKTTAFMPSHQTPPVFKVEFCELTDIKDQLYIYCRATPHFAEHESPAREKVSIFIAANSKKAYIGSSESEEKDRPTKDDLYDWSKLTNFYVTEVIDTPPVQQKITVAAAYYYLKFVGQVTHDGLGYNLSYANPSLDFTFHVNSSGKVSVESNIPYPYKDEPVELAPTISKDVSTSGSQDDTTSDSKNKPTSDDQDDTTSRNDKLTDED